MATVDELVIQIKADVKDLNKKMKNVNRQLDDVGKKGSKGMGATNRAGKGLNTTMMGLKASTLAVVGALAGIVKVGGMIARVGSQFEDLKDSLDTVFGSIEAGDEAMDRVFKFAQTTPFQIETATKAFIALKSAGIEPSNDMLQTFADTASVSTDQLGTFEALIRTVQRAASGGMGLEELNQIADRGIDVLGIFKRELNLGKDDLAAFGKTAEGANVLVKTLIKGLEAQFGGAMGVKMDNLSVKTSNMEIAFKQLGDEVFKSGLDNTFKSMADNLTALADSIAHVIGFQGGRRGVKLDLGFQGENDFEKEQRRLKNLEAVNKEINRQKDLQVETEQRILDLVDNQTGSGDAQREGLQGALTTQIKRMEILETQLEILSRTADQQDEIDQNEIDSLKRQGENIGLLSEVLKTYEKTQDPLENIKALLEDNTRLLELAEISSTDAFDPEDIEQYRQALSDFIKESEKVETAMGQISEAITQSSMAFTKDFTDSLLDGEDALESFRDFSQNIVSQIIAIFLQMAVINRILNAVFFGRVEGFEKLDTIGGKAGGGTIQRNAPVLVGERGPEIFVPNTGGTVMNNMNSKSAMGGGDIIINQSLNFSTGVQGTVRTEVLKLLPTISEVTKASVMESASRGGNFAKAIRG